jgi:hypothetical protein
MNVLLSSWKITRYPPGHVWRIGAGGTYPYEALGLIAGLAAFSAGFDQGFCEGKLSAADTTMAQKAVTMRIMESISAARFMFHLGGNGSL